MILPYHKFLIRKKNQKIINQGQNFHRQNLGHFLYKILQLT